MKKLAVLLTALLLVASLLCPALAARSIVSPNEDFYYYDDAGVLTDETKAAIYFNNVSLNKACGAQIAVVVVNTLNGIDEGDYAYRLINEWGVGDKDERNGIVILLAIREDTYFVTVGEGIERFLTPDAIYNINNAKLEPDFARKKYDAGVEKTFRAYFEEVRDHYGVNLSFTDGKTLLKQNSGYAPQSAPRNNASSNGGSGFMIFILGIILVIVIFSLLRSSFRRSAVTRRPRVVIFPSIFRAPRPPRPPRPPRVPPMAGPRPGPGPRPSSFNSRPSGGFGASRPSGGFGAGRSGGGFSGGRSGGSFGGGRSGGGGGRGAGAGRGR